MALPQALLGVVDNTKYMHCTNFQVKKKLLKQSDYRNFRYVIGNLKYDLSLKFSQYIFVPHVYNRFNQSLSF